MCDEVIVADLSSFKIPILALGDQGQIPPVKGKLGFNLNNPLINLDELVRTAQDDPIAYISFLARTGQKIPYGTYGKNVFVVRESELSDSNIAKVSTILSNTNKFRDGYNQYVRELLGFDIDNPFPNIGEKIICRRNDWESTIYDAKYDMDFNIINGLVGRLTSFKDINDKLNTAKISFTADFSPSLEFKDVTMDLNNYTEIKAYRDYEDGKNLQIIEYAYCLTTHLSQGSEYPSVLYDSRDMFGDVTLRKQLSYTGITRAKKLLIYVQ